MDREEILKLHKYKIWKNRFGKWITTLPDPSHKRGIRSITRSTEQEIYDEIDKWYSKDEIKRAIQKQEIDEALLREQLTKDFSSLKEIKVFDVQPGLYSISPIGNIYSLHKKDWKELQLNDQTKTYPGQYYIALKSTSGEMKRYSVARLVMAVYNGMPPEDMVDPTVDHIDQMPLNNYYRNLRWIERGVNSAVRNNRGIGEMNSCAKLTYKDVAKICNLLVKRKKSVESLALMFNVSELAIKNIKEKRTWQYITAWFDFD